MNKSCCYRGVIAFGFAVTTLASSGCGGSSDGLPREAVSGAVTVDGLPLESGAIQFFPASKGGGIAVSGGSPVEGGEFSIDRESGLVPGRYKVAINAAEPENLGRRAKGHARKGAPIKDMIPAKYNSKTELEVEIEKGGSNRLKLELHSK